MQLVIYLRDRGNGRIAHPLPSDDPAVLCEIVGRLAPYVPREGVWWVEGGE